MGVLSHTLGIQNFGLEDPAQPLLPPSALFESLGIGRSDAGILMNERQAMRITTVYACIRIISEDLSSVGLEILQNMPDGSQHAVPEHPVWSLIHDRPNPHMTAMVFWGAQIASAVGWGNSYAWIKRDVFARPLALIPLASGKTAPVMVDGELKYGTTQTTNGATVFLEPENVLHIPALTMDGIVGLSPVQVCKNAHGLAAAAEKFGAQFFGNGARATGVFSHPEQLDGEALENLKKSVREMATGENALAPVILEEGMTWKQVTIPPNDAQFLATRQFQRAELAALHRVALHLLQDLARATNNNIEWQSIDHIRYCLRPWAVRIEQEINYKLLKWPFVAFHDFSDFQRGDFASLTSGLQTLRNSGFISANDGRRKLRMNSIPEDEGGDLIVVQGAMIPLGSLVNYQEPAQPAQADGGGTGPDGAVLVAASARNDRMARPYRGLIRDLVGKILNRADRDHNSIYRAARPVVSAMVQGMVTQRYGTCEITSRENKMIDCATEALFVSSANWNSADGSMSTSAIAENVLAELVDSLAAEIF